MKLSKYVSLLGSVLLSAGLVLAVFMVVQNMTQREALSVGNASPAPIVAQQPVATVNTNEKATTGIPANIRIESIGMDLEVRTGVYDEKTSVWTLADDAALYASSTSPLSTAPANTLIYGHRTQAVFASLFNLTPGDQAIVRADNDYEFVYTYTKSQTVKPDDVAVLQVGTESQLTLQTCTGVFDQYREIFSFTFTELRQS